MKNPVVESIYAKNRWNADEAGLMEGQGSNSLVLGRSEKSIIRKKQPGSRVWTSFIECVSATGSSLPPLVIFKGKSVQEQWFPLELDKFDKWQFTASENGWTDDEIAVEWLKKVFIPGTTTPTPEKRLLVLDGYNSHTTVDFI